MEAGVAVVGRQQVQHMFEEQFLVAEYLCSS
jgi:hypothetical protein